MLRDSVYERLCACAGEKHVRRDELMKNHTTFRIGGPADYFVTPREGGQIQDILEICRETGIPWYVIGNGSNLLVGDGGYRGVIIQIFRSMNQIETKGERIRAQAGALLYSVSAQALQHSLSGMEFAAGIPGTLGGAVVMNAGAYGGEMKDILEEVTVLKTDGTIAVLPASELALGYRTSIIREKGYLVLEAVLSLREGMAQEIQIRMDELKKKRWEKQPLEYPSAGSAFKRPEGYFAGKLIMEAGLGGYRVGGAEVSEKHCGFIINTGDATAKDVYTLMRDVQMRVRANAGVELEPEIKFLGDVAL